jgi:hypothetical protein
MRKEKNPARQAGEAWEDCDWEERERKEGGAKEAAGSGKTGRGRWLAPFVVRLIDGNGLARSP